MHWRSYTLGQATHWKELRTGRRELRTGKSYALKGANMERDKNRGVTHYLYKKELHKQTAKQETSKQIILKTSLYTQQSYLQALQKSLTPPFC